MKTAVKYRHLPVGGSLAATFDKRADGTTIVTSTGALELRQVLLVSRAVGKLDVEIALLLHEREVARAVQRQRKHRRVVAEDGGGAVALVHVEVDDDRGQRFVFALR